jgi:hypothetical protein
VDAKALWGQVLKAAMVLLTIERGSLLYTSWSDVLPGSDEYVGEAWERMTYGGIVISISEIPRVRNPWGISRFREPTPVGGLELISWDDDAAR